MENTLTMANLFTNYITPFFTAVMSMFDTLLTTVTGSPYLMIGVSIVVISFGVGLLLRIARSIGHSAV